MGVVLKGWILGCDSSGGAISTDAGERFKFAISEWKGPGWPAARDEVDFIGANGAATEIYPAIVIGAARTGTGSAASFAPVVPAMAAPAAFLSAAPSEPVAAPNVGASQASSAAYSMSAPQQVWPASAAAYTAGQRPKAKLWRGNIRGRLSRKDFWGFWLILFLCQMVILIVVAAAAYSVTASGSDGGGGAEILRLIGLIARPFQLIITGLSLNITIRRLHDSGHTGWWVLLNVAWIGLCAVAGLSPELANSEWAVPYTIGFLAGGFVQLWPLYWIFIQRGDKGPNKFGPDPLMPILAI